MAKKYQRLRKRMDEESRQRAASRAKAMMSEMPLQELRRARQLSQEAMAELLGQRQSGISKIEQRTDMYMSTLRRYIEAMGGHLDVVARFPEGEVRITQFENLEADPSASPPHVKRER